MADNQTITRIADVQDRQNVTIEGTILEVYEVKEIIKKTGEKVSLQEVMIDDGDMSMILTLWEKDINSLRENDKVRVQGYVTEYNGNKKISKGKYGKIEKILS
ncbi:MAG: single stranded DNA-binding domain-containing protein [Gammaproteobacteria bacterium]